MLARLLVAAVPIVLATIACRSTQPPAVATPVAPARTVDPTIQADNDRLVRRMLDSIGDRRTQPAPQVFKNVTWLTNTTAAQFLSIMNGGYARALGVRCVHCHVESKFASDEKRQKRAAREMAAMHRMINQELRKMQNLASTPAENRAINCSTCHRGMVNPMASP
jgi:hypothetical protein